MIPTHFVDRMSKKLGAETTRWEGWPACPCGCSEESLTLTRFGHVRGCSCRSCTGRRNRTKGQKAQAKAHRRLGGEGFTPSNEEAARPYHVEVVVMPEVKTGQQIPASWDRFEKSEWFRHALSQSERAVPVGSGALPCVVLRGDFAVVDIRGERGGRRDERRQDV